MILTLDKEILLDVALKREPFFKMSYLVLMNILENGDTAIISASSVTDIYYIVRKMTGDENAREAIWKLREIVSIAEVTPDHVVTALESKVNDFEDALLSAVAKSNHSDYIITRNEQDFTYSSIPAITPEKFVNKIGLAT